MRTIRTTLSIIAMMVLVGGMAPQSRSDPRRVAPIVPGTETWVARFNGAANQADIAKAVAVSPDGSRVFVTGRSSLTDGQPEFATVAYEAGTGEELWEAHYSAGASVSQDVVVSPDAGTVFVTGFEYVDGQHAVTIAYDAASGTLRWVATVRDTSATYAVAVSPDGSTVAVTGHRNLNEIATIGYAASTGDALWASFFTDGGYEITTGRDIAASPDGRTFYTTGYAYNGNSDEYVTEAIDAGTGHRVWAARYNSQGSKYDNAYAIAVSPNGARVFVTGSAGAADFGTIAYDAGSGRALWLQVYDDGATDVPRAIAVTPDGSSVLVTGSSGLAVGEDYLTTAYDAATGTQRWIATYDGPGHLMDVGYDLGLSPDGSRLYVTGASYDSSTNLDYGTLAYDVATGDVIWTDRYDDDVHGDDSGFALAVAPSGAVFVTGRSHGAGTADDYATVALTG